MQIHTYLNLTNVNHNTVFHSVWNEKVKLDFLGCFFSRVLQCSQVSEPCIAALLGLSLAFCLHPGYISSELFACLCYTTVGVLLSF